MLHTLRLVVRTPLRTQTFTIIRHFNTTPFCIMGDNNTPPPRTDSSTPASISTQGRGTPNPNKPAKKQVKILMLHGYTQSGPLFRAKTRALEKLLAKALAPVGLVPALLYPTAPNRLSARDIPGYQPQSQSQEGGETGDEADEIDSWAWFRRDAARPVYNLVERGMGALAEAIKEGVAGAEGQEEGVVDGVVGFSQGGCVAAMLAAVLEADPPREVAAKEHEGWARALREANGGRPLKFAVIYSGFWAVPEDLAWLYEPKIKTPTLHFLGSLDTVVDESRSQGLVERCEAPVVVTHPGGHHVPVSKEWAMPVAGFIRKCMEENE